MASSSSGTVTLSLAEEGPVGTPITITVVGMGSPTYESVGAVLYDNHYAGAVSANMTRGVTSFKIRAAGEVGPALDRVRRLEPHRPVPEHAAVARCRGRTSHLLKFTVTGTPVPPKARIERPRDGQPTIDMRGRPLIDAKLAPDSKAKARNRLEQRPDPLEDNVSATGLTPSAPVRPPLVDRSSATGSTAPVTCWKFIVRSRSGRRRPPRTARSATPITIPDGLGGWHVVQLVQGGKVMAQVPYFVKRSFVSAPKVVKAGQPFIVELKGVGWTQLDNTVAVTYDNSYIGYACGFNSNGYVRDPAVRHGRAWNAPDRPLPAALHAAARVPVLAARHGAAARVRDGRTGPRGRVRAPGLPASRSRS